MHGLFKITFNEFVNILNTNLTVHYVTRTLLQNILLKII